MLSSRGATACAALVAVLVLFAEPTAAGAVAAADDGTASDEQEICKHETAINNLEYFLGDLVQGPVNKDPKSPPRFRPWRIFNVSVDGVLAFDCAGDVPTLRLVPRSDQPDHSFDSSSGTPPPETCGGGGPQAGTLVQYKFSRADKPRVGYSARFWARPSRKIPENRGGRPLMPLPKLQLKAILKALAALMDATWREEMGEAMPESVPFPADTVGFYIGELRSLVIMGREDVEFHKPWEKFDGEIRAFTLGGTIV